MPLPIVSLVKLQMKTNMNMEMRKKVQEDPNKPITQIYEEVRKKTFKSLDEFGQIQLSQDFPSFRVVQSSLYKERRCFIPPEPKSASDLQLDREMFYLKEDLKETMIK